MKYDELKPREKAVVDTLLAVLAERDEGYHQTLSQMDQGIKQGFQHLGLGLAVMEHCMRDLGITDERMQEIAQKIAGGSNEQPRQPAPNSGSEIPEVGSVEGESGDEHFEA